MKQSLPTASEAEKSEEQERQREREVGWRVRRGRSSRVTDATARIPDFISGESQGHHKF